MGPIEPSRYVPIPQFEIFVSICRRNLGEAEDGVPIRLAPCTRRLRRSIGMEHVGLFAREDTSAPIVTQHGFEYCGEMEIGVCVSCEEVGYGSKPFV